MQAHRQFTEPDIDETADTVVFSPKPKLVKRRKILLPVVLFAVLLEFAVAVMGFVLHSFFLIGLGVFYFLFVGLIAVWYVKQTRGPRMKPRMILAPDGFSIETDPYLGVIPWDEIADVQPGRFLGTPMVRIVPKNKAALRQKLGAGGRFMWMYWEPKGGLGVNCIPFGMSPEDLAARVNRYRERGL